MPHTRLRAHLASTSLIAIVLTFGTSNFLGASDAVSTATMRSTDSADQWPRYRGLNADGVLPDTGSPIVWPAAGPPVLWRLPVGSGYSSISVSDGLFCTLDSDDSGEFVLCGDAATGRVRWRSRIDQLFEHQHGDGPRSTPTLDEQSVYALSASGTLAAFRQADGKKLWTTDIPQRFGKAEHLWFGYSMSPLVLEDQVLLAAGGNAETALFALDKATGQVNWTRSASAPTYSTPLAVDHQGRRQIIFLTAEDIVSTSPDGEIYWSRPWGTAPFKAAMPIHVAPDKLFFSMSYDVGSLMLRLGEPEASAEPEEVWSNRLMRNHFNSSVLVGNHLYGFDNTTLKCLDAETGEVRWEKYRLGGRGSVIAAGQQLLVLNEHGKLLLVEANPHQYVEQGSFQALTGRTWTAPTLIGDRLMLRNQQEIACFDLGSS